MEFKKKNPGIKTVVLLLLLLLNLFAFSTSSYALTPSNEITGEMLEEVFTYFLNTQNVLSNGNYDLFNNFLTNCDFNQMARNFNENINTNIFKYLEQITFFFSYYQGIYSLDLIPNNNTIENSLNFIQITETQNYNNYKFLLQVIDENKNPVNLSIQSITNLNSSGGYSIVSNAIGTSGYQLISSQNINFSSNGTVVDIPGVLSIGSTGSFYIKTYNTSGYLWYLNKNYISPPVVENPEEPTESGDSGGSGTTGTITNPSGDTTGKVDLSGIEQGIDAVKDAVNNVTNTIKDAFTFDSGDAKEVMEEFENTDLGLSQDLYDLNNQFFELFETEEMDDFKISWSGVNYQEAQLIPSGEVNFSAICRENEQIGKVKDYITLFAIVGASFTLLKVIWNMLAEMLGLNQTLMETDFGDAVMYTYEDNSYDTDTRAYLDHHYYTKGGRRH